MRKGTANREQVTANKEQKVAITNRYLAVTVSCWLLAVPLAVLHAAGEPDVFAQSGVGARPAGMGSAFVGLADDVETIFYNPAGLGTLKDSNLAGMLQSASLGTTRNMMAANVHWERGRFPMSVGFGWLRLHSGDIEVTSAGRAILGTEDFNQDLYVGSYGLEVIPTLSLGVNLKYFKTSFADFSEGGFGVDAGVLGAYPHWRWGVVWTDLTATTLHGDSVSTSGGRASDKIPPRIKAGASYNFEEPFHWPLSFNVLTDAVVQLQGEQDTRWSLGGECWLFQETVALRSGYQEDSGPTAGLGLRWKIFQFDYAFLLSQNLQDEHRLGTTIRF